MNRIEELEKIIKINDELYWSGNPKISDEEYDSLVEELKSLDPNNKLINKINPLTNIVDVKKVKHKNPMLSLDKVYSNEDLFKWVKSKSRDENEMFLIQPKYDGISGKIENYTKNFDINNVTLSTRGNGYVGENITDKLSIIKIDSDIEATEELLGEILITKDDFKNLFSKIISPSTKKPYKNPRNATAGIMGTDDVSFFEKQNAKLTFVDYNKNTYSVNSANFEYRWEMFVEMIQKLPYPMDGIVVKLADNEYANSLGNTAHHPRSAVAFKFKNPQAKTKVIDMEWSFGKNYLTPVAILEPVDINGITVERVSVANYENLKKLNLNIGDEVIIERAGDVIPHIVSVIKSKDSTTPFIDKCPCCNSELKVELPELICPNDNCKEKIIRRLLFSIRSLGIDGVGIPTITKIYESANIDNLYGFLKLNRLTLTRIGFGDKTAENIINSINKTNVINDYQFITCLNIADVGEEVAKLMLTQYSIEDLMLINRVEDLTKIKGIGEKTAIKVIEYFRNNLEYAMVLRSMFQIIDNKVNDNNESNGTVCFTGAMDNPRKYYEEIALQKHFTPVNSVSKDLTYLVVADLNSNSSKMQKARKYEINIITVEEFMAL